MTLFPTDSRLLAATVTAGQVVTCGEHDLTGTPEQAT